MQLSSLGVNAQKEKQFSKKGIYTAEDLVRYLPRKYKDFTKETGILSEDEVSCVTVHVDRLLTNYGRIETLKAFCTLTTTGEPLVITWFNQNFLKAKLQGVTGRSAYVAGKIRYNEQYHN